MDLPVWLQLVGFVVPAAVSIFAAFWASRSARRAQQAEHEAARLRDLERRVAEQKAAMYEPVVKLLGDLLSPPGRVQASKHIEQVIGEFQSFITLWASDEANEAFFRFRASSSAEPPSKVTMRLVADFLLAVRRDVAWPDTQIDGLHAVGMRINDLEKDPGIEKALTLPLHEVFEMEGWVPPFRMREFGPGSSSR